MNMVEVLLNSLRRYPEKLALIYEDTRLTYKTLNERCNRLANSFENLGIKKGDHISLLSKNSHHHFELFFAGAKSGVIYVPLNYRLSQREIIYTVNDSESKVLFFSREYLSVIKTIRKELKYIHTYICTDEKIEGFPYYEEVLSGAKTLEPDTSFVKEDDLLGIFYTTGTTGYPKGVMVSHRNRFIDIIHQVTDFEYIESEDVYLNIGPLFHVGVLALPIAHLYMGCTVVILKEFDAKRIFETIESEKVTTFWAAPTMVQMILDYPEGKNYNFSSIKTIAYSSSPMPLEILRRGMEFFGPNVFVQFFGATETGPQITHLSRKNHLLRGTESQMKRLRSVGVESQMVHVRIVDNEDCDLPIGQVGEIVVRSEAVTKGYWKKPEETKQAIRDGWYHTGDLGYMDEDRFIYIVDRKKDMIITGGRMSILQRLKMSSICIQP